jgi:hypothetical protein
VSSVVRMACWFALLGSVAPGVAGQFWVAWEGNDLPENQGWTRNFGNWQGQYHGGAVRTLANGVLTIDSLYDAGVYDFCHMDRPIDPGPGERFVMEWGAKVDTTEGHAPYDADISIFSDDAHVLAFGLTENAVIGGFESGLTIPVASGVFHDYAVVSSDMLAYQLYIDGQLAHAGSFWQGVSRSSVGWGDGVQGAASLHRWDYFRFGVIPEPGSFVLLGAVIACCGGAGLRRKIT